MPNYEITPAESSTPVVTLYSEFLNVIPRRQNHNVERHDTIAGASPASDTDGLEPGEIGFDGRWVGAKASDIVSDFRDKILDDASVNRVDVQAINDSGSDISDELNGTYRIAEESRVDRQHPDKDTNYRYRITLIED